MKKKPVEEQKRHHYVHEQRIMFQALIFNQKKNKNKENKNKSNWNLNFRSIFHQKKMKTSASKKYLKIKQIFFKKKIKM